MEQKDTIEIWKPVEGYEGLYEISSFRRVKSYIKSSDGAVLQTGKRDWYTKYLLHKKGGSAKHYWAHRLVAIHFIPNPLSKPMVNHIDGDKTNNRVGNLEWVTVSENARHARSIGLTRFAEEDRLRLKKSRAKGVVEIGRNGEVVMEYESISEAARKNNIPFNSMYNIVTGLIKSHRSNINKFKFKK